MNVIDNQAASIVNEPDQTRHGGLGLENPIGSVLACYLIYLVALFMQKKSPVIAGLIGALCYALIMGMSRGAWVTLIFGLILLFSKSKYRVSVFFALIIPIIFASTSPMIRNRFLTSQEGAMMVKELKLLHIIYIKSLMRHLLVRDIMDDFTGEI